MNRGIDIDIDIDYYLSVVLACLLNKTLKHSAMISLAF